jgi:transcriptional regulator with XRE-family HTH domain
MPMTEKEEKKKEKLKMQKRFGEHIRMLRKQKGLTPAEFGKRCELERSNVAKIEGGAGNITLYSMIKISKALGIKVCDLLKDFEY